MDMTPIIGLEGFAAVLLGALACVILAVRPQSKRSRNLALHVAFTLWWFSFVPMLAELGDWVHLYWAAQVPLVALFMISGPLLLLACQGEADRGEPDPGSTLGRLVTPRRAPWSFLAMMATVGLGPMLLIEFLKAPSGFNTGEPTRRLLELARWGLGGTLPGGVGPIPREATVSLGALLIAAWLWIAFCAIAIVGRMLPWTSVRRVLLLFAPLVLGIVSMFSRNLATPRWLDRDFFWGATNNGVWTADPIVLKSFGPVLLAACTSAILLAIVLRFRPARSRVTRSS